MGENAFKHLVLSKNSTIIQVFNGCVVNTCYVQNNQIYTLFIYALHFVLLF